MEAHLIEESPRPALPMELHAATREKHHALNVQALAKLPLCLPPNTNSSLLYAKGMIVFGQIYFAFEDHLAAFLANSKADTRLQDVYRHIHFPRLQRSAKLQADVELLKQRLGDSVSNEIGSLATTSKTFYQKIDAKLSTKPHVLLAYAWTMYLALFNGGRWIQKVLASAGPSFWLGDELPLSFWAFEDAHGHISSGEDLKASFKDGFVTAAALLNNQERDDVIEEARMLFDMCLAMIEYLDGTAATIAPDSSPLAPSTPWSDNYKTTTSVLVPMWKHIASTISSVTTSAATAWRGNQVSSD